MLGELSGEDDRRLGDVAQMIVRIRTTGRREIPRIEGRRPALHATRVALGRRGLGRTWPNPAVGCVIVRDGAIVGRGWTQPGGRPHAETEALRRAGAAARGATPMSRSSRAPMSARRRPAPTR